MNAVSRQLLVGLAAMTLVGCGGPTGDPGPGPGPTGSLVIVSSAPANGATGVPVWGELSVAFSVPVEAASVRAVLSPEATLGSAQLNADGTQVSFGDPRLAPNTAYTLSIEATSTEGVALGGPASIQFETGAMPDTQAPTLVSSSPAPGATQVAGSSPLVLTFSEAMDPSSLLLSAEPEYDFGPAAWSADGKVATFAQAPAPLAASTRYAVSVHASDVSANPLASAAPITFTVAAAADLTAPTVEGAAPAAGATNVATNASLSLAFSEPMDQATVVGALSIAPATATTPTWDAEGRVLTLQPAGALGGNVAYTVTLGVAARDLAQNSLAAPYTFSFTTGAAPDTTRPSVASSLPGAGDSGVARNATIKVTFSEPMDKAATEAAFSITAPTGYGTGAFSWSADGKTMTYDPVPLFTYGDAIAWRVTTAAKDLAGNALSQQVSRGFLVTRLSTAVLDSTAAVDGYVWASNTVMNGLSTLAVGDNLDDDTARALLSFDLSGLPSNLTRITSANIYINLTSAAGDPGGLGGLQLERVYYGASLKAGAFDAAAFTGLNDTTSLGTNLSPGWKLSAQLAFGVGDDWANRASRGARSQFRLRFPKTTYDKGSDYVQFSSGETLAASCPRTGLGTTGSSCRPHLVVSYEHP